MRTKLTIALGVLALATAAHADEPKSLLFYGNSFSGSGGGVHTLVRDIATAAGHATPHVYGRIVGGQTLEWHEATGTSYITTGIPAGDHWDAVIMQEYSTRPTDNVNFGNVPAFLAAAEGLYQAVLDHSPDAQAVLFETWARAPGHSYYPGEWPDPATMQSELRHYYGVADDQLNTIGTSEVASVGDAFELAGFDTSLYGGDLYHASNRGALLISLVLYGTIYDDVTTTDIDLSGVATGLGLAQTDVDFATTYADQILAVPSPASAAPLLGVGLFAVRRRR